MTDAELLQHYIECKPIIDGAQRSPGHLRLLKLGLIKEHPVSLRNLLIIVTAAGRTAIECRPAEYVGTHPTRWRLIPPTLGQQFAGPDLGVSEGPLIEGAVAKEEDGDNLTEPGTVKRYLSPSACL